MNGVTGSELNVQASLAPRVPRWFPVVGVIFAATTVLFFMGLVIGSMFGLLPPPAARFLVVTTISLCAAFTFTFLGADAAAKGHLRFPWAQDYPIQFSTAGGVAVFVIVLLLANWAYPETFARNGLSTAETQVLSIDQEIFNVRGTYESIPATGDAARDDASRRAAPLADEMSRIPDDELRPGYEIEKYQYAAYAYVIAADTDRDEASQREYATRAVEAARQARNRIEQIRQLAATDSYSGELAKWIRDGQVSERVVYVMAMALTIQGRNGDAQATIEARRAVDSLPTYYKERYPPDKNPVLRALVGVE